MESIEVYALRLDEEAAAQVKGYLAYLSLERQETVRGYRSSLMQARTIAAELLARALLAARSGKVPLELEICRDARGKPYSPNVAAFFSWSHSGAWVVLSIGGERNGVDVEGPRRRAAVSAIARRFFRPEERRALDEAPRSERHLLFLRYWTMKESYLKYTGDGLAGGIESVDTAALWRGDGPVAGRNFLLSDGAVIGVCAPSGHLPDAVREISFAALRAELSKWEKKTPRFYNPPGKRCISLH